MTRARILQEVRPMRFEERYARRQRRTLTLAEAGEMLGVTERTVRRWSGRYHAEGAEGVQDRRIGRLSARAVPVDEALRRVTRDETRYTGWTVKHFPERWRTDHGGTRSYRWTKKTLQAAGQVTRATRRAHIASSDHANPCRGCCCNRPARPMKGAPVVRGISL